MIIVNFKNYKYGKGALKLVKLIERYNKNIIVAVSAIDLSEIINKTKLRVYAQHVDNYNRGRGTGYVIAEALKYYNVKGSLINHSEHQLKFKYIKDIVNKCRKLKLRSVVCVKNLKEVKEIKKLRAYAIAFEDPKLIATSKSIVEYNTINVKRFVKILKNSKIIPLCGAGINSREDILKAYELGCKGVLISSSVANSNKAEKFLMKISDIK